MNYQEIIKSLPKLSLRDLGNLDKALYKELDRRTEKLNSYKDERGFKK